MDPGNKKAIVAAMLANGGIAIGKFIGFAITGASSMMAEGVHSVADTGNQALLLLGSANAAKPASPTHPFGYGRERYFWCFVVSLVIFALGAVYSIYEGVHKVMHPEPLSNTGVALAILGAGLLLEGMSFRTAVIEGAKVKGRRTWMQFVRQSKEPELPVVLLEDLGALIGLALAIAAIGIATLTGDPVWDGLGSIVIGLLLGVIAVLLSLEMKSLLIGEAALPADRDAIRAAVEATDGVRLIHMRTQHIGPDEILLGCKVEFDANLSFEALTHAIDAAEARVRAAVPDVTLIYMEPDVHDPLTPNRAKSDGHG